MIVVFGSINVDFVFQVDALPIPGQTLLARRMRTEPGGKGANQAVAAARDQAAVAMIGAVGADPLAEVALGGLRSAGVDLTRVEAADAPTGCATVCTDPAGRNQIVVAPGANLLAREEAAGDALLAHGPVMLTQMEADAGETARLILRARRRGARPIHNLAPAAPLAPEALRALEFLVVNEDEAAWIGRQLGCDSRAAELHAQLGVAVVRTLGGAGVEWAEPGDVGGAGRRCRCRCATRRRPGTASSACWGGGARPRRAAGNCGAAGHVAAASPARGPAARAACRQPRRSTGRWLVQADRGIRRP